ncbi:MAG: ABC transporter ATP-binding protein [Aeromicrobium sp.]|uniref:ABC transporter ATP-binding protein n=1 Tax=Aeromicrobium sp. TaxID=1871063 RepID=UPI0025BA33ED|nr:ABC transporter ATP-binding protein [Aeromicrobium sp.]MCK5890381.1 ABC transporter ATP-binding protein [Aeromicrobium sp.]MDF1704969.1 ABC transporter ATP-binding protein [Aeromicrobium sp.]
MTDLDTQAPSEAPADPQSRHHDLRARGLTLGYAGVDIVHELDLVVPDGLVTVVVGANGCGKSTLLRGLARLLKPRAGGVELDGRPLKEWASADIARVMGLLPQNPVAPDGITVADLVSRGRYPHQGWFRRWSAEDDAAVEVALAATHTTELAGRTLAELSGGQRQRVWVAMVLAQDTDLVLLDEPTTFLDISHQVDLLDLLDDLNHVHGKTVVMVLHDLNLACRYAHHIVAMKEGRVVAQGAPKDVITAEVVDDVFGLPCRVVPDPVTGTPLVVPLGRQRG